MSFNIVDLVKDQVKGQLIGHMGNLLGNEGGKATGAVDSMIPALLNGMSGSASTNEGANNLFGAIQNQDDSLLDNMGSMLSGGQAATVVDNGNSVLSGLFGSGGLGKLAGALSAFSGVSKGGTSSLMGMLAPIILGVLKRKVMGDGLDASGLSNLMSSQSNNISASMPNGLGDQLSASGLLSSIGGVGAGAAGAVAAGAASMASGARDTAGAAAGSVSRTVSGASGDISSAVSGAAGSARDGAANVAGNVRDGAAGAVRSAHDGAANAADTVGNVAGSTRDGVANAAGSVNRGVHNTADAVGDGAQKGGSMFRWLLPLVVLAGLAWAAFTYLIPGGKDAATDATGAVTETATGAAATATDAASDATEAATDAATGAAATATDAASDATEAATEAATDAAATATDAASDVTEAATDAAATATDAATDAATGAAATATDAVAGAIDPEAVQGELSGIFSGATETLSGITDVDSATAALPALEELGTSVDSVSGMMEKIPEAARGPFSGIVTGGMEKLQPVVDNVMGLDGVGDVVGPILTPIMDKIKAFGG